MKKIRIRSAIPIYLAALVWLLFGCIRPGMLLHIGTLLLVAAVSALAYAVGSKVFPGREVEVRERADTGDAQIDRQIEEGRERLERLQAYNDQLPDPVISERLGRMKRAGDGIFAVLEKNPAKASEVRRFMNYYLPASEKIMADYVAMAQSPAKGENIQKAMRSVENTLGMVADAFEKQLDSLYRDKSFDMEAETTVLETLLKSEGLAGGADFARQKDETLQTQTGN